MGPLDEAENRGDFPLYHKKEVPDQVGEDIFGLECTFLSSLVSRLSSKMLHLPSEHFI